MKIIRIKRISSAGLKNWKFHMHRHQNILEITYIMKGKGNYFTEGKILDMKAGDLVIKNANVLHGESADDDQPLEMFWIAGIDHPRTFFR